MHISRRRISVLAAASALVLVIGVWIALAPAQLGGQTVYVIIRGSSMEPGFHRGDLVLLRQAASYAVGDIATYRHPDLGPVIHRIVAEVDGRFVLQGDNNAWLDSYQPTQAEMIGKFWTFIPSVGKIAEQVRQPWAIALLTAAAGTVVTVSLMTNPSPPQGHLRRRRSAAGKQTAVSQTTNVNKVDLFFVITTVAVAALMLGLFSFTRPTTRKSYDEVPYTHAGRFSYSAAAPPGLYNGNQVKTGEPIFRRLITRVNVAFAYQLQAERTSDLSGATRLVAVVSSNNGWRWTFELQGETSFQGDRAQASGVLDLARLQAVLDGVEQQTGVAASQYTLALAPTVTVSGTLAGLELQDTFAPQAIFLLDALQMQPASDPGRSAQTPDPLQPTQSKTLRQAREIPNTISLLSLSLTVSAARILAAVGMIAALLSMAGLALSSWRKTHDEEPARIQARYGALLVNVHTSDLLADRRPVLVAAIADLARIAERGGRMILHEASSGEHRYFVQDEDAVYCYRAASKTAPVVTTASEGER
jgi:signal peptidase I